MFKPTLTYLLSCLLVTDKLFDTPDYFGSLDTDWVKNSNISNLRERLFISQSLCGIGRVDFIKESDKETTDKNIAALNKCYQYLALEACVSDRLQHSQIRDNVLYCYLTATRGVDIFEFDATKLKEKDYKLLFTAYAIRWGIRLYEKPGESIVVIDLVDNGFTTNLKHCSCERSACEHKTIAEVYTRNRVLLSAIVLPENCACYYPDYKETTV